MALIVILTGAAGFIFSAGLLHAGMTSMGIRYLTAFGLAYLVFLAMLWLWMRIRSRDYLDPGFPDFTASHGSHTDTTVSADFPSMTGEGGTFGGGGASGHFDLPISPPSLDIPTSAPDIGSVGDVLGATTDADELALPLVVLLIAAILLFSSAFVVYEAPILFAEMIVDGVLTAGLYHRLRGLEPRHWLEAALRRTFLPFLATALVVAGAGWAMQTSVPGAISIGGVIVHAKQAR